MPAVSSEARKAHIRHGIKTGLASVLAYILAQWMNLSYGYWGALSAVIVMQINVADSIRMCWYRFSGTAVGALIGIIAILAFPATQPMTMVALFISVAFCAYMTRFNTRYRMAAITVTIVVVASLGEPDRVMYALFRVMEIATGVLSAFIINITIWPIRAGTTLKQSLNEHFSTCADRYNELLEAFLSHQEGVDENLLNELEADVAEDQDLFKKVVKHERLIFNENTALLSRKIRTLERCIINLKTMLSALNNVQGEGYDILMRSELRELADATMNTMRTLGGGDSIDTRELELALLKAEGRLMQLREEGVTKRFYLRKLIQFFSFYHGIQSMAQDLLNHSQDTDQH